MRTSDIFNQNFCFENLSIIETPVPEKKLENAKALATDENLCRDHKDSAPRHPSKLHFKNAKKPNKKSHKLPRAFLFGFCIH